MREQVTAGGEVRKLLDQIRALTVNPVIQRCSDEIEVICSAYMEPDQITAGIKLGLTGNCARIFDLLHKREGQICSREALQNVCKTLADSMESIDTVDVHICTLRKKLAGTKYEGNIEAVRGIGYMLRQVNKAGKPFIPYAERKECPRGHAYTPENTYVSPKGMRVCRKCRVLLYKERYKPKREAEMAKSNAA